MKIMKTIMKMRNRTFGPAQKQPTSKLATTGRNQPMCFGIFQFELDLTVLYSNEVESKSVKIAAYYQDIGCEPAVKKQQENVL